MKIVRHILILLLAVVGIANLWSARAAAEDLDMAKAAYHESAAAVQLSLMSMMVVLMRLDQRSKP